MNSNNFIKIEVGNECEKSFQTLTLFFNNLNININEIIIIGSEVHKYLSNNNYMTNDLDILINIKYKDIIRKQINKYISIDVNKYNFSNKIITGDRIGRVELIYINIDPITFIKNEIPFKFLQNYWKLNDGFYKSKENIMIEDITPNIMFNNKYNKIIRKYINRGIKFNIINDNIIESNLISSKLLNVYKLNYQQLGFVVIPLNNNDINNEGKAPCIPNWTTLENSYNFKIDNNVKNIGIVCGENSGIICLDIDEKDNGTFYFNKILKNYNLPIGPYQITPNNGKHYIFKYNKERMQNMKSKIKCISCNGQKVGIDLFISKSQFVVYPSINYLNKKQYIWIKNPWEYEIPELPEWIYEMYYSGEIDEDGYILNKEINMYNDLYNIYDYIKTKIFTCV